MASPEIDGFILPSLIAGQARHRVDLQVLTTLDRYQIVNFCSWGLDVGEPWIHQLHPKTAGQIGGSALPSVGLTIPGWSEAEPR